MSQMRITKKMHIFSWTAKMFEAWRLGNDNTMGKDIV